MHVSLLTNPYTVMVIVVAIVVEKGCLICPNLNTRCSGLFVSLTYTSVDSLNVAPFASQLDPRAPFLSCV